MKLIIALCLAVVCVAVSVNAQQLTQLNPPLSVYTFGTQFPSFDLAVKFCQKYGYTNTSVKITSLKTANIVANTVSAPAGAPAADIILGVDNTFQYEIPAGTFQAYTVANISSLATWAVSRAGQNGMTPYDYAAAMLNADTSKLSAAQLKTLRTLTLANLTTQTDLLKKMAIMNPRLSQIGRAFFLSTVAHFGDPVRGITGLYPNSDWRNFWKQAFPHVSLYPSWNDAWTAYTSNPAIAFYTTYSTSPAYDLCSSGSSTSIPVILDSYKWYLIEFVAIHKNSSTNLVAAKQFMDFMANSQVQSVIPTENWMMPASTKVSMPACYNSSLVPTLASVPEINYMISTTVLQQNLGAMLNEWDALYAQSRQKSAAVSAFSMSAASLMLIASFFVAALV